MRKLWFCALVFTLVTAHAWAGSNKPANTKVIPLATGEWKPYTSASMQGYGFFTEIVTLVLQQMDLKPKYKFFPWRRCYLNAKKGLVWAAFPYSYTDERAKEVWFSDNIAYSNTVFFYYDRGRSFVYNNLKDLKAYRVGGVLGYFYEQDFKDAGIETIYWMDENTAIQKLRDGAIDLLPLNELVGWTLIKTKYPDEVKYFKTLPKIYNQAKLRLIVSKKFPDSSQLLRKFNAALAEVKKSVEYQSILKKYLSGQ